MTRYVQTAALVALLGLAAARPAFGQTTGTAGTSGTTTTFAATDFFISIQHPEGVNLTSFDLPRFFNKANCDCDEPVSVYFSLTATGLAKRSIVSQTANIQFWVGTNCYDPVVQRSNCVQLMSEPLATFFAHGRETIPVSSRLISTYSANNVSLDGGTNTGTFTVTPTCTTPVANFTQYIYALVDVNGDQLNDIQPPASTGVLIDLNPPPTPANINVAPGNEALNVSWDKLDISIQTDLIGYQVMCQRGAGLQVFPKGTFTPSLLTCPKTQTGTAVEGLDPLYVCSPLLSTSASSFRVKILQNDIPYGATVVAIDNSYNASTPELIFERPEKTNSFYDVYRQGDSMTAGKASGGFCAVAAGDARRPAIALGAALTAFAAVVFARRRRRP